MAGLPLNEPTQQETLARIGGHDVHSWSLRGMSKIQIFYLRLPDSAPSGQGYDASGRESLKKLYNKEIKSITTTDGNATYTLKSLEGLIATILHERRPNSIRILDHKASIPNEHNAMHHHADHVVSAKLVQRVVTQEKIKAEVQA
jgi:LmbE family N-acetylglucosaminyl deacetylase